MHRVAATLLIDVPSRFEFLADKHFKFALLVSDLNCILFHLISNKVDKTSFLELCKTLLNQLSWILPLLIAEL